MSLRRLGVETIDLWQLHRIDPKVPREEQFGVMKELQDEGKVRHLGLSEVSVEEIKAARRGLRGRDRAEPLQPHQPRSPRTSSTTASSEGIGFIPWFPLAAGELAEPGGPVAEIAERARRDAGQVALAWLLARSPVMLPIPGTGSVEHLEENVAAADLELTAEELARLDEASE